MTKEERGITFSEIQRVLPFATLLIAVVMSWASLTSQNALQDERLTTQRDKLTALENKVDPMKEDVTKIKTIIENAQRNGQITYKPLNSSLAFQFPKTTPTPSTGSAQNMTVVLGESSDESAQMVAPNPTPEPLFPEPTETPKPIVDTEPVPGLLDGILGAFGL